MDVNSKSISLNSIERTFSQTRFYKYSYFLPKETLLEFDLRGNTVLLVMTQRPLY